MGFIRISKKKIDQLKNHEKELRREELFSKVSEVLALEFKVDKEKIKPDSRLREDLGLDSIDAIQLTMSLEQKFDFEIPDEDTEKIQTVEQIVDYLLDKLK